MYRQPPPGLRIGHHPRGVASRPVSVSGLYEDPGLQVWSGSQMAQALPRPSVRYGIFARVNVGRVVTRCRQLAAAAPRSYAARRLFSSAGEELLEMTSGPHSPLRKFSGVQACESWPCGEGVPGRSVGLADARQRTTQVSGACLTTYHSARMKPLMLPETPAAIRTTGRGA